MSSRDMHNQQNQYIAFTTVRILIDGTTAGVIIDTQDFQSADFFIMNALFVDGTDKYIPKIEHGNDSSLSDAEEVSTDFLLGTIDEATILGSGGVDQITRIGYVGKKQYIRLSIIAQNLITGSYLSAVCVLQEPSHAST